LIRELIKVGIRVLANVAIFPVLVMHWLKIPFLGSDRALEGSTQSIAILPGILGQYARRAFLGWTLEYCHASATVCFGTIFSKSNARIEENVYIGPYCTMGSAHIGRDTLIATAVHITSGNKMHGIGDLTRPIREQPGEWSTVHIGAGCWIGSASVIMADVGDGSVIGAGAVVTKDIPAMVIAGGVPAKVIKTREEAAKEQQM
jgi:acetyltransferase-like isoleucine patch superfamily enzyme